VAAKTPHVPRKKKLQEKENEKQQFRLKKVVTQNTLDVVLRDHTM